MSEDYTYDSAGNRVKRERGFKWGAYAPVRLTDEEIYAHERRHGRFELCLIVAACIVVPAYFIWLGFHALLWLADKLPPQ